MSRLTRCPFYRCNSMGQLLMLELGESPNLDHANGIWAQLSKMDLEESDRAFYETILEDAGSGGGSSAQAAVQEDEEAEADVAVSPNPFNPTTQIAVTLAATSQVQLGVFDMLGRRVATLANGKLSAGSHQFTFDGAQLATGVYVYHLSINGRVQTGKMTLLK